MKKIILSVLIIGLFLIGFASAIRTVDFYYNPSCPHCKEVAPLINTLSQTNFDAKWIWNFYDVSQKSYSNIDGVPTLIFDNFIKLQGSYEIPKYAECYLQEQSTLNCPTIAANICSVDWFIKES